MNGKSKSMLVIYGVDEIAKKVEKITQLYDDNLRSKRYPKLLIKDWKFWNIDKVHKRLSKNKINKIKKERKDVK